jgi:hypothetical protein
MHRYARASGRVRATLVGVLEIVATVAALAAAGPLDATATTRGHGHRAPALVKTPKALALHDAMRTLWEQHVAWTRLTIVSFAAGNPDLQVTQRRLLRNQADIGRAIAPYYGRTAARRLTRLLTEHITGAVAVLQAARAGTAEQLDRALAAWRVNGRQIADFLHAANPRNWPRATLRAMMRTHLDQTVREASAQLTGDYAASVREYDAVERHILRMADTLSRGIVKQFPRRFR